MNIELDEFIRLVKLAVSPDATSAEECLTTVSNRYVIVRGNRSGVFAGYVGSVNGTTVVLYQCRHIWYWSGAANVADMALHGVRNPGECKFVAPVDQLTIFDSIEMVDCTDEARRSIEAVSVWTK